MASIVGIDSEGIEMHKKERTYSRYTHEAAALLARQIKIGRKERRWTEQELAERAGIARATLQKIEKGDLGVAVGLVFEVAALAGVTLFDSDRATLAAHLARADDKLTLLPEAVRRSRKAVDDAF